ncbi:MAG: DUF2259 domain-containing protein [Treponema sp.]|jgi:predicted secreted protein|nr:DUF2259 domain-containing protein [Treponema sp.]
MLVKKYFLIWAGLLVWRAALVYAGDSASFVDLGFSHDGNIYMFAQYGVKSGGLKPWADLFVVDISRNDFVSGGKVSYTHDSPIVAGQDGSGALYRIITRNAALVDQYGINFPNQGQPLYIALEGDPAYAGEAIEFRDFESGFSYQARLLETVSGSGAGLTSSFHIKLTRVSDAGQEKTYVIGTPDLKRPHISSYRIKKALIAPHSGSLVFVIEMKRQSEDGPDIRYMVEALRF